MNKRIRAPLAVGIVGVGAVAAFIALFGTVQQTVVGKGEGYRVTADFDDVSGLVKQSRVTMAGIPIGTIDEIQLIVREDGSTKARVFIRIKPDVALYHGVVDPNGVLKNCASVTRRTATMLGDYYLDIAPGVGGERLQDGEAIPKVVGEAGFMALAGKLEEAGDIMPQLRKVVDNVAEVTESLSKSLGGPAGQARVEKIAADIEKASNDIAAMTGVVRDFVGHEVGGSGGRVDRVLRNVDEVTANLAKFSDRGLDPLVQSIKNIEAITEDLRVALASDPAALDKEGTSGVLGKLHRSLDNLDSATRHLSSIVEKVDKGEGTVGKLINDDAIAKKAEEVIGDVGELVKTVTRIETAVGFRSEYNWHQRALKNYFSLRLQPRPDKYYLLELVFDPRGKTRITDRVTLTNDPSLPATLSERITETTSDIKFSFQFAKRVAFLTGRFGLMESTGGVGLDFEFLKDTMKFTFDVFDFSSDQYPRLKFLWTWEFVRHFYVAAGVDDVMNKAGRDYFFGAGVRFDDRDLKALLISGVSIPTIPTN